MLDSSTNLEKARRYLKALEDGIFTDISAMFAPGMVVEQLPNRIYPKGIRASLSDMASGFEKGKTLFSSQSYQILNAVENSNLIALEVLWTGRLAVSFGNLPAGERCGHIPRCFWSFRKARS
jgi:hypothetical protein